MSNIRIQARNYLVYILAGVLILCFVWEANGMARFVGLFGLLIVFVNIIRIVTISQQLIDDFFPPQGETETKLIDKFIGGMALALFFGGLVSQIFEIAHIDNTIGGAVLFLRFGFLGLIIGGFILFCLHKIQPSVFYDSTRRYSVFFGILLGLGLMFPAGASYINRNMLTVEDIVCDSYQLEHKKDSKYIYLIINREKKRFEVDEEVWKSVTEKESVEVCFRKGRLGYDFLAEIKSTD